jgi:citrate lyase subunit alpha / citrate CoA-transferase
MKPSGKANVYTCSRFAIVFKTTAFGGLTTGVGMKLIKNSLGRLVPQEVNGRAVKAFAGCGKTPPSGNKIGPAIKNGIGYENKMLSSLQEAVEAANLKNGSVISFHHHLRNGDFILNQVLDIVAEKGLRDLIIAPSALFPCHEPLCEHIRNGVVSHIEGSMNGPVGRLCSTGGFSNTAILRSHGGRYRAIQDGDLHVDAAFISAPSADPHGNATGDRGKSACGPLGFALADSLYADHVTVITDNLIPFPCFPWMIEGGNVDRVVKVDAIGDREKIISGTTRVTTDPNRVRIAEMAAQFVRDSGIIDDPEFSFQAGAGGMSLKFIEFMGNFMRERNKIADFARGGSTELLVSLLNEGLVKYILDGQSFDLKGVESLRDNPRHINTNPFVSYNYHTKGCFAPRVKAGVLGATEIDFDFNVNVNTHSDGWLLHGIGGFTDAADAEVTIITAPLVRKIHPVVVPAVHTVTAPGETIDVLVTDHGIAINPRRQDLIDRVKGSDLPICSIEDLHRKALELTGGHMTKANNAEEVVAVIEYRDGTIIDSVRRVIEE